jgi:putative tributyrin esterase
MPSSMQTVMNYRSFGALLCGVTLLTAACKRGGSEPQRDSPRLTPKVTLSDVTFHSTALNRDMQYRVVLPANIANGQNLPVVYLLHGGGGGFRDWSNYSDVAHFAEQGLILVMPEGNSSYFTNAAERPKDKYEDYIVIDLISDAESKFPVLKGRANRAIIGVSMGGFGAVKLGLRHPELFAFVGGISPAIDVPSRPFSIKRLEQWRRHRAIFGAWGSVTQRNNDPFVIARSADPAAAPYIFLSCGEQDGLLPSVREFAAVLGERHFQYEFHTSPGGHNWAQWNAWVARVFQSLSDQIHKSS